MGAGNPATDGKLSTVGIRAAGGNSNGRQIEWSYNAAVLGNSTAIRFSPRASGQTSVNTITGVPVGLTVGIDGVNYTTPKVVSWTPGSNHTLSVATPQVNGGSQNTFSSQATVGATAAANYSFAYFSGGLTGLTNPQNIVMNGAKRGAATGSTTISNQTK